MANQHDIASLLYEASKAHDVVYGELSKVANHPGGEDGPALQLIKAEMVLHDQMKYLLKRLGDTVANIE